MWSNFGFVKVRYIILSKFVSKFCIIYVNQDDDEEGEKYINKRLYMHEGDQFFVLGSFCISCDCM